MPEMIFRLCDEKHEGKGVIYYSSLKCPLCYGIFKNKLLDKKVKDLIYELGDIGYKLFKYRMGVGALIIGFSLYFWFGVK